jgi:hypothetical protein
MPDWVFSVQFNLIVSKSIVNRLCQEYNGEIKDESGSFPKKYIKIHRTLETKPIAVYEFIEKLLDIVRPECQSFRIYAERSRPLENEKLISVEVFSNFCYSHNERWLNVLKGLVWFHRLLGPAIIEEAREGPAITKWAIHGKVVPDFSEIVKHRNVTSYMTYLENHPDRYDVVLALHEAGIIAMNSALEENLRAMADII